MLHLVYCCMFFVEFTHSVLEGQLYSYKGIKSVTNVNYGESITGKNKIYE
jgi:hypothetical protein